MTLTTATRSPIKQKTLTLSELCQSITELRRAPLPPPPTVSTYQYQSTTNTAQILTRRLYLHPLTINTNAKQALAKRELTSSESDSRSSLNLEQNKAKRSPPRGLAVLSTSLPLIARRLTRDKSSTTGDTDMTSETDVCSSKGSFTQSSLPSILRGRSLVRDRPVRIKRPKETPRWDKEHVWFNMDQVIHRTTPVNTPSTPVQIIPDYHLPTLERETSTINFKTIQEIRIYKRNPKRYSVIDEDEPIYDESLFV